MSKKDMGHSEPAHALAPRVYERGALPKGKAGGAMAWESPSTKGIASPVCGLVCNDRNSIKYGILFDLDGTLLDTLEDLTDATNYALAQFGCPARSYDYIRSVIGNGALRQIALALPQGSDLDPQAVLKVYKDYYNDHCNVKTRPYSGILEALAQLSRKYPIGIVTNKPHSAAAPLCAAHFPGVYALGEEPGCPRKPNPDMVYKAMADLGVDQCIYVGDSEVDITTANHANVPCLTVTWGLRTREQLIAAGATHFCDDPADLPNAIEEILNP